MAFHDTVLSPLLKMLPGHEFEKLANAQDGRRRSDALSRRPQSVALSAGHSGGRASLRDIEATRHTQARHRYHLGSPGISCPALGRANEQFDRGFHGSSSATLYERCTRDVHRHGFRFKGKLFMLDGSLIDLSMKLFPRADCSRREAAFKWQVGLDHDDLIPAFAALTSGRASEMEQAGQWHFPKGGVLVFDKGYDRYAWHDSLSEQGFVRVTHIRANALYRVIERRPVANDTPVTSDQVIEYTGEKARKDGLPPLRRIGFGEPAAGKHSVSITGQFQWPAQTTADIYQQRWQVELFFKWIRQSLKIKVFPGMCRNAVMTQVRAAPCLYLLLACLKFQSGISKCPQQIPRLLQTSLFIWRALQELLKPVQPQPQSRPQWRLGLVRN